MSWSIPLGTIAGTKVRVHSTFLLFLAWVAWDGWDAAGWEGAKWSVAFVVLVFACVLAHEFGHIVAAKYIGIRSPMVTLWPIGGVARLERMPERPIHEIAVALAGPAVNVVIGGLLFAFLFGPFDPQAVFDYESIELLFQLMIANGVLAAFNLLPAFPMDGGRVLRAVLAWWLSYEKATKIAAIVGQIAAFGLAVAGYFYNPMLYLIAAFIFFAAQQEANAVAARERAKRMRNPYGYVLRKDADNDTGWPNRKNEE